MRLQLSEQRQLWCNALVVRRMEVCCRGLLVTVGVRRTSCALLCQSVLRRAYLPVCVDDKTIKAHSIGAGLGGIRGIIFLLALEIG